MKKITKRLPMLLAVLLILPILILTVQPLTVQAAFTNIQKTEYINNLLFAAVRDRRTQVSIPNSAAFNKSVTNMAKSTADLEGIDGSLFIADYAAETSTGYNGYVTGYRIVYKDSFTLLDGTVLTQQEAIDRVYAFYDALIADMPADLDDVDKVLFMSNRLCQVTEYDYETYDEHTASPHGPYSQRARNSVSLVGPALQGLAVCQGYALAFKFLCDKVGIPCRYSPVDFESIGDHAANLVTLNGKDYVVDVTHSDGGNLSYLLCSAEKYAFHCPAVHHLPRQMKTAYSYDYDNAWWTKFNSDNLFFSNGAFYGLRSIGTSSTDGSTVAICRNGEEVARYSTFWLSNISGGFSKIHTCSGDALYYNRSDAIWKYNCKTGEQTEFFRPANPAGKKLVNFYYDGTTLKYILADDTLAANSDAFFEYYDNLNNYTSVEKFDADAHTPVEFTVERDCAHSTAVGVKCAVCGVVMTEPQDTGVMGPHQGEWSGNTATCTAAGTESITCTVCGETITRDTAAKGHNFSYYIAANVPTEENHNIPATCLEEGRIMAMTCADCGYVKPAEITPKVPHNYEIYYEMDNLVVTHNYNEMINFGFVSCTRGGTVLGARCTKCGNTLREPVDYPNGFGHDWVESVPAVPPTCTTSGRTAEYVCSRCKQVQASSYVSRLNHDFQPLATPIVHEATCTTEKEYFETKCSRCDTLGSRTYYYGSMGHIDANNDKRCDDCGIEITDGTKMRGQPSGSGQGGQGGQTEAPRLNFFQRIIEWIRNLFARLFNR